MVLIAAPFCHRHRRQALDFLRSISKKREKSTEIEPRHNPNSLQFNHLFIESQRCRPVSRLFLATIYDLAVCHDLGLGQLFHRQAQKCPEATAVVGDTAYTYAQLHSRASQLAHKISEWTLGNKHPVGIVVQHGMADVVAQLAIIYAGDICAPIDPTLADHQIFGRLGRLNARRVLTDGTNRHRDLSLPAIGVDDFSATTSTPETEQTLYPVAAGLEQCRHLIHTSGTTDEPKAVQIAARSILHVVFHAPFEPLYATDIVAHVNNSSFDVSLFNIWAPLIRGACIAILSKADLLDMPILASEIHRLGITVMATTTALLNLAAFTYPQTFASLRICFIGGEVANFAALKIILDKGPPGMLINAYGPTECCIFCLAHRVTSKDIQDGSVRIGMPIGRTIAYIVDEVWKPSNEGELYVGGPGLSLCYVNQPGKNAAAFVDILVLADAGDPIRLYRTGDIVRRRPNGQIDYIGRRDQVKIRGYRIELGAVESALLGINIFMEVAAIKVEMPQEGAGSILVAYAVPANLSEPPAIDQALELVRAILPAYMVLQLELISQMPLNSHAKVDRNRLKDIFSQRWRNVCRPEPHEAARDVRSTLAGLWTTILALPVTVSEDLDFVSLGGTSLQASLLISQIRRVFGISVSLLALYDNSSLGALTSVISKSVNGHLESLHDDKDTDTWIADSMIADDLPCPSSPAIDWRRDTAGRVFFSGATGFVGAFMLADPLRMPHIYQIGCLVRASDGSAGLERLRDAMVKYNLWDECFAHKLLAIPGLLEDEYLGMGYKRFNEIALWASVVFHLGARVNYTQPYSLHRPANTLGTRNFVRFAYTGRNKPIHYVSSISCFGPTGFVTGITTIREDEPLLPHLAALPYDHGYAQSQWVVEQLLRRLMDRGFPIAIYRPGFIIGHSQTGACNPDDFFSRLIYACCEMGCFPKLPYQFKEFVPVDYVSEAILHIAASPTTIGRAYHLVPPTRAASIDMDDSMDLVGKAGDWPMRGVSYSEWIERLAVCSPERLLPLLPMLAEKVQGERSRWELYENIPVYETTNTEKALEDYPGGLKFPVLELTLMKKYLDYLGVRGQ